MECQLGQKQIQENEIQLCQNHFFFFEPTGKQSWLLLLLLLLLFIPQCGPGQMSGNRPDTLPGIILGMFLAIVPGIVHGIVQAFFGAFYPIPRTHEWQPDCCMLSAGTVVVEDDDCCWRWCPCWLFCCVALLRPQPLNAPETRWGGRCWRWCPCRCTNWLYCATLMRTIVDDALLS